MDLDKNHGPASILVCPVTKLGLELVSLESAEKRCGEKLTARAEGLNAKGKLSQPAGRTPQVLLREDLKCAYPVVGGIPILLAPEALSPSGVHTDFHLSDPRYAEAYEEMDFYNNVASSFSEQVERSGAESIIPNEMATTQAERDSFPAPWYRWLDTIYDSAALWDAYSHLGDLKGRVTLQLGGTGSHAVKFALAGAAESWLITPVLGEASVARSLAESAGVGARFRCVAAIAEELPFRAETFDAIFISGSLHHMQTELAVPESGRVLRQGGKFAAVEPWRAPLYSIGTRVLGQREHAYCHPLNAKRVDPMHRVFGTTRLIQHGTLTRYPLLALSKFGIKVSKSVPWYIGKADDAVCSLIPGLRRMGSSIAVLGKK